MCRPRVSTRPACRGVFCVISGATAARARGRGRLSGGRGHAAPGRSPLPPGERPRQARRQHQEHPSGKGKHDDDQTPSRGRAGGSRHRGGPAVSRGRARRPGGACGWGPGCPAPAAMGMMGLHAGLYGSRAYPHGAGHAGYQSGYRYRHLDLGVWNIRRLAGRTLVVYVHGTRAGAMTVSRSGYAHLYRSAGVPRCQPGQPVRVRTGTAPWSPPARCAASRRQQARPARTAQPRSSALPGAPGAGEPGARPPGSRTPHDRQHSPGAGRNRPDGDHDDTQANQHPGRRRGDSRGRHRDRGGHRRQQLPRPARRRILSRPRILPVPAASAGPGYTWYQSMMSGSYGGMMMGGGPAGGWMMSQAGYQWMTGGTGAPGWMTGGTLPGRMMGARRWHRPREDHGPPVGGRPRAAGQRRAGRRARRPGPGRRPHRPGGWHHHLHHRTVRLTVLAARPAGPTRHSASRAWSTPPSSCPAGAQVSIEVINADPDTAHGLVSPRHRHHRRRCR